MSSILFAGGRRTGDLHDQNPDMTSLGIEHRHLHVVEATIGDVGTIGFPIFDSGKISSRRMDAQPSCVSIRDQDHLAPTRWDDMQSHLSKKGRGREDVKNYLFRKGSIHSLLWLGAMNLARAGIYRFEDVDPCTLCAFL